MIYKTYVFCDLDQTLVDNRDVYLKHGPEPEYGSSGFDRWLSNVTKTETLLGHPVLAPVFELLKQHLNRPDTYVCYLTGRRESLRDVTQQWLKNNNLPDLDLHMRPNANRNDAGIFKTYFIKSFIPSKSAVVVFDDDPSGILTANALFENWVMVKPEYDKNLTTPIVP